MKFNIKEATKALPTTKRELVSIHKCYKKAKANLLKYGWIKHDYGTPEKGFCLVGALDYPRIRPRWTTLILECLVGSTPVRWNDSQKSVKPVLALLDTAIKLTRPKPTKARHKATRGLK